MSTDTNQSSAPDDAQWGLIEARLAAGKSERWQPAPGDQLLGTVVAIDYRAGDWGTYAMVTISQKDTGTPFSVRAGHQSLVRQLSAQKAQAGDLIGIHYDGQVTTDTGSTPHRYRVAISPQSPRTAGQWFDLDSARASDDLGLVDMGPNP